MNSDGVNLILNELFAKLEIPMQKGFEYVCGIGVKSIVSCVIWLVALFVLLGITSCLAAATLKREKERNDSAGAFFVLALPFGIFAFAAFVRLAISVNEAVFYVLNPEAWALDYIFTQLQ